MSLLSCAECKRVDLHSPSERLNKPQNDPKSLKIVVSHGVALGVGEEDRQHAGAAAEFPSRARHRSMSSRDPPAGSGVVATLT